VGPRAVLDMVTHGTNPTNPKDTGLYIFILMQLVTLVIYIYQSSNGN